MFDGKNPKWHTFWVIQFLIWFISHIFYSFYYFIPAWKLYLEIEWHNAFKVKSHTISLRLYNMNDKLVGNKFKTFLTKLNSEIWITYVSRRQTLESIWNKKDHEFVANIYSTYLYVLKYSPIQHLIWSYAKFETL